MIFTENITLGGKPYVFTYSDSHYLLRDGILYGDAIDPPESGRTYIESDVELAELSPENALMMIVEGDV